MTKKSKNQPLFISLILILLLTACTGGNKNTTTQQPSAESVVKASVPVDINAEAKLLLEYLDEQGDYVNSRNFPSMIKVSSVHDDLDGNIKIIDLRDGDSFKKGHIKNAANVNFSALPDYFANDIKPLEYDKIILVCYAGQIASYATLLLRLMGYDNVFTMKWGMSGWNKDFADDWWLKIVSSKYEDKLEKEIHEKAAAQDFPALKTGKETGKEIFDSRIKSLFEAGTGSIFISADSLFNHTSGYYVINYDRRDKYENGHIPGAIRYKPNGTLGIVDEMQTIPADQNVVIYCQTGQNSGFVSAYLRLFGYNAKSLIYGNNAFMHDIMVTDKIKLAWSPFTNEEIENYPYEK